MSFQQWGLDSSVCKHSNYIITLYISQADFLIATLWIKVFKSPLKDHRTDWSLMKGKDDYNHELHDLLHDSVETVGTNQENKSEIQTAYFYSASTVNNSLMP